MQEVHTELEHRVEERTSELRESVEKYRSLVESISDVIFECDRRGMLTYISPVVRNVFGYEAEDLIGKTFLEFVYPEDSDLLIKRFSDLTEGAEYPLECRLMSKSGEVRHVRTHTRPIMKENAFEVTRGTLIDITERKLAELVLRVSEQTNRLLIEQAPIGIVVLQEERVVYVNPAFLEIFGYESSDEVIGLLGEDLVSPEDRELTTTIRRDRLNRKHVPLHYEAKGLKKNGESFDLAVWPTVVDYDGKPAILTFFADTSEAKSLRSQLLQAQKMEAIGTLAGGVAHDFNNLLQIFQGYSQLLLIDKRPDHPDYRNLNTINASAKRGADLVQRLMVFSRKGDTKPRPLNLNHEVTQIEKLLERTIPKMISIELRLEDALPVINADSVQVEQILLNLAINAKDAMPESGGKLTIETRNITLDEEYCRTCLEAKPGQYVMISVSDTGHGISKETMQHIFEPFFTTKSAGKGTGLGLAMVYGIMKHHEGFINCYSEIGHGTTFRLYFPVVSTEIEENLELDNEVPLGGSETILLVDDEEFLCDIGSQILTRAGYTCLLYTSPSPRD